MEPAEFTLAQLSLNPDTGFYDSVPWVRPADRITVVGTGFGTKPFSEPVTWETFDGTPGDLVSVYDPTWVPYNGNAGGLISDLNPRFAGHKSAYNVATRGQFDTNYKTTLPRKSRTRFLSYYTRVNYREDIEAGQIKFARITTSAASGGGGVYNGAGSQILNAPAPKSWNGTWTGSNDAGGVNLGYLTGSWFPANRWMRIEYEIYLSDLDTPNGFFNIHCPGKGSVLSGSITQRFSGYGKDNFLLDTTMIGIETVNTEKWVAPSVLSALTTYTFSCSYSSTNYIGTWVSGSSVPTAAEIVTGITNTLLLNGLPPDHLHTNPANAGEFGLYWGYSVTYGANLVRSDPISVQQGETYEDDDFKRFYLGDASTWAACVETNPQPYSSWTDTEVHLSKYAGAITGQMWLYKQLLPNTTPIRVGEVVGTDIIYG
jgi:hypothetical protein